MRVLICEPNVPGHHLHYASLVARAAREVTDDVVLGLSREAVGTYWHEHFVRPLEGSVTVRTDHDTPRRRRESGVMARVRNGLAEWTFLERYILDVKPDHVVVPSGNRVVNVLAWLPRAVNVGAEIELVLFNSVLGRRTAVLQGAESWLRRILIPRARAVTRFHFTDQTQYVEARRCYPRLARRFMPLADPIDLFDPLGREEARHLLGVSPAGRIAVMVSPTPYKGVMPLLELFRLRKTPADCRLLLVGHVHETVEQCLRDNLGDQLRHGQIVVLKDRTDEIDLHRAICAADVVIPRLTPMHGTSAMCIRAAVAGRRFLAPSSPWMEMMARDLGLGDCFVGTGPDQLATAFCNALDRSSEPINPELVRRLRQFHRPENFMDGISDRVRVRAGLGSSAGLTWDWVLEAVKHPTRSSEAPDAIPSNTAFGPLTATL